MPSSRRRRRRPTFSGYPFTAQTRANNEPVALPVVDVTAVSNRDDHDEENIICNRVNDAVITDPNAKAWATLESARSRRARVLRQQRNCTLQAMTDRRVELAQGANGRRTQLDPIVAQVQPRSTLTCSQGMFGPSSFIAASKAAASSASSKAATSLSYCSGLTSTAAGRP